MVMSHSGEWDAPRDWLVNQSEREGREAIQTALNELTALGYRVVTKERQQDGTWRTVVDWYHYPMPRNPSPVEDDSALREDPTEGRVSRPPVHPTAGQPVLPPEHQNQNTKIGDADAPPSPLTQFALLETPAVPTRGKPTKKEVEDETFARWWAHVPRKVAKGQARSAWAAALKKAGGVDVLIDATRKGIGWNMSSGDPKYMPYPATWLNGERWADEPTAQPKAQRSDDSWMFRQDFGNPLEGIER
jgi:hypothetical protein